MAARRKNQRKTDPEQVSGISAAAIEGAAEADNAEEKAEKNAEKMARPGPGLPDRRVGRRGDDSNSVESTRRQSSAPAVGMPEDENARRGSARADSDELDELGGA